jgi:hypothetical protein
MNTFLKLPLAFDPVRLIHDLQICESLQWIPHFNAGDYSGEWSSIALRSASGEANDIHSHPNVEGYRDTQLLEHCRYFREVLNVFQCEKESARLLRLAPGARINEHKDVGAGYQYDCFRVHIPLQTSEDVFFRVGGHLLDMKDGECWYADFSLPHSVENHGAKARVNLILDCKRNAWSDQLFGRAGYDFDAEARARRPDAATRANIIAELSAMKTETADRLIRQLMAEAELDE